MFIYRKISEVPSELMWSRERSESSFRCTDCVNTTRTYWVWSSWRGRCCMWKHSGDRLQFTLKVHDVWILLVLVGAQRISKIRPWLEGVLQWLDLKDGKDVWLCTEGGRCQQTDRYERAASRSFCLLPQHTHLLSLFQDENGDGIWAVSHFSVATQGQPPPRQLPFIYPQKSPCFVSETPSTPKGWQIIGLIEQIACHVTNISSSTPTLFIYQVLSQYLNAALYMRVRND